MYEGEVGAAAGFEARVDPQQPAGNLARAAHGAGKSQVGGSGGERDTGVEQEARAG